MLVLFASPKLLSCPSWILEYLPTLKPWNLLKSGWVMKNLLPNLVHGILRRPFRRLCPWHGVGRLPNRNGSWKNSYLWFFSRCCDELVFVRKSVHSWQTCTKWPLGEGLGFVAPFTHLCCGGGGTGGRVTIQVSISYFSIVFQKCWTIIIYLLLIGITPLNKNI